jgi:hypothetical protein
MNHAIHLINHIAVSDPFNPTFVLLWKLFSTLITDNMSNTESPIKNDPTTKIQSENQTGVENHKKAAMHLEEAAKNHHEAAKHEQEGNHEKASHSTIKAHGHTALAAEAQKKNLKHIAYSK